MKRLENSTSSGTTQTIIPVRPVRSQSTPACAYDFALVEPWLPATLTGCG